MFHMKLWTSCTSIYINLLKRPLKLFFLGFAFAWLVVVFCSCFLVLVFFIKKKEPKTLKNKPHKKKRSEKTTSWLCFVAKPHKTRATRKKGKPNKNQKQGFYDPKFFIYLLSYYYYVEKE